MVVLKGPALRIARPDRCYCGKITYRSIADAKRAAKRRRTKQSPYQGGCGQFHLTTVK